MLDHGSIEKNALGHHQGQVHNNEMLKRLCSESMPVHWAGLAALWRVACMRMLWQTFRRPWTWSRSGQTAFFCERRCRPDCQP